MDVGSFCPTASTTGKQALPWQRPPRQECPQLPQWSGSIAVFTQALPHAPSGDAHAVPPPPPRPPAPPVPPAPLPGPPSSGSKRPRRKSGVQASSSAPAVTARIIERKVMTGQLLFSGVVKATTDKLMLEHVPPCQ